MGTTYIQETFEALEKVNFQTRYSPARWQASFQTMLFQQNLQIWFYKHYATVIHGDFFHAHSNHHCGSSRRVHIPTSRQAM